ncbi:ribonuclease R [Guggenheimella bovis]
MLENEIKALLERRTKALSAADIQKFLGKETLEDIEDALDGLVHDGILRRTKKGKYSLLSDEGCFSGVIELTERGFGFFISEREGMKDIFVHKNHLNGAMNGDKVLVCISKPAQGDSNPEGYVEKVLEHNTNRVVGKMDIGATAAFVVSLDRKIKQDIYIPLNRTLGAKQNDVVEVEITKYAKGSKNPEGRVTKIIGKPGEPFVDIQSVASMFELETDFPEDVLAHANTLKREITAEDLKKRRDLRDRFIITIDGRDAKDFDDAISIEPHEKGYLLGVHIADVTHYVKENDPIDREAFKRGTSIYFPGMVIPMLPEILSNELCSLRPGEDSLTLSVEMVIDKDANVVSHEIFESVIHSKMRLVYDDVSDFLEGKNELFEGEAKEDLLLFKELAEKLEKKQKERGSIDFGFVESEIIADDEGRVVDIKKRDRRIANKLIEAFMILTNEVVSEHYGSRDIPFLYRTHEKPSEEKLMEFNRVIYNFGFKLEGTLDDMDPVRVNELIQKVKGTPYANIVNKLMLRSLKQAKYTNYMEGHFGLASTYYSHFTSPIRRYPDLQIHRIIKENLQGLFTPERKKHYEDILEVVAEQSSERERNAEESEREVDDIKMAEFMQDKIGQCFEGTISSVTSFGLFVELENTVEGLIRLSELKQDFYHYEKETLTLKGERTGARFTIGDKIMVQLIRVNVEQGEINFGLAEESHD